VIFDKHGSGPGSVLYQVPSNGASAEHVLLKLEASNDAIAAGDWSRDGRTVLFHRSPTGQPPWSIWGLSLADRKPFPYKQTPGADTRGAKLSPNGRFVAYMTNESGTYQVVVQPFPDASGGKWQVSDAGGALPVWRRDGRELFYLAPSGDLMAVNVMTEGLFTAGTPMRLFRTPLTFLAQGGAPYDVTADGQRFLLTAPVGAPASSPLSTILNWPTLVTAK
jgi:Tol biopolymer transport system component